MPAEAPRPAEGAATALARSGDAAASLLNAQALAARAVADADALTDALLEVRAARERLRHVDSLLAALVAEVRLRLPPEDARGRADRPRPAPDTRVTSRNNSDADYTNRAG